MATKTKPVKQQYVDKYKAEADLVLSSKNKVAATGRWGDADELAFQNARHMAFMASLGTRETLLNAARQAVALGIDKAWFVDLAARAYQIAGGE